MNEYLDKSGLTYFYGKIQQGFATQSDLSGKQSSVAKLGSSTQPVYTSAAGTFATCSTYAGGTAVTLNGTSKAASTASLYAPTSAGTNGQILVSSGSGAPSWSNLSVSYPDTTYSVNTASVSGAVSIDGRTPLHILTVTANVSSVALSYNPSAGHSCHVIFKASSAMTVALAYDSTNRITPNGQNISLSIPAGGYVELNFLSDGTNVYVRGI